MSKSIFCIVFTLIPLMLYPTCIIIFKTNNAIYIAADSRSLVYRSTPNTMQVSIVNLCKIHNVGNIYFAISGVDDMALTNSANAALNVYKNVDSAMYSFEQIMVSHYKKVLSKQKLIRPDIYNSYKNGALASVSFFGFIRNTPYLKSIDFFIQDDDNVINVKTKIERESPFAFLGADSQINALTDKSMLKILKNPKGLIWGLEELVKMEVKHDSTRVNYPIDLLQLSSSKVNWVRRKKECN